MTLNWQEGEAEIFLLLKYITQQTKLVAFKPYSRLEILSGLCQIVVENQLAGLRFLCASTSLHLLFPIFHPTLSIYFEHKSFNIICWISEQDCLLWKKKAWKLLNNMCYHTNC